MDKNQIISSIKAEKPYLLKQFGVEEIAIFGSYARDEQQEDSDVDILVSTKIKTLNNYFSLLDYLESKIQKKIDLVTKHKRLSDRFSKLISKDMIYV